MQHSRVVFGFLSFQAGKEGVGRLAVGAEGKFAEGHKAFCCTNINNDVKGCFHFFQGSGKKGGHDGPPELVNRYN